MRTIMQYAMQKTDALNDKIERTAFTLFSSSVSKELHFSSGYIYLKNLVGYFYLALSRHINSKHTKTTFF